MPELVESHRTSKARLLRLLDEAAGADWVCRTIYLTAETAALVNKSDLGVRAVSSDDEALRRAMDAVGQTDTGLALFLGERRAIAVCPPFPLRSDARRDGMDAAPLRRLLRAEFVVGVVLLRLGRYAVGVARGERLLASKTSARYVKNRHRAGGQSQRRFERSRERLVRELYDKTCETAQTLFAPFEIDYIMLGGEGGTLAGFAQRCRYVREFGGKALARRLAVEQPNQKALNNISFEVYKSRVYLFQSV